jgi:hypothetical protein
MGPECLPSLAGDLSELALSGLVFEEGVAGLVGAGDLFGCHGLDESGADLTALSDSGPSGFDGRYEGLALADTVVVDGPGVVLVTVPAGDTLLEPGGSLFFPIGGDAMAADVGFDDLVSGGGRLSAHSVIGPLGTGGRLVVPAPAELATAGLGGFDLGSFASEATRSGLDDPGVVSGREVLGGGLFDQLGAARGDAVGFALMPGSSTSGFSGSDPVGLVVPLSHVISQDRQVTQ